MQSKSNSSYAFLSSAYYRTRIQISGDKNLMQLMMHITCLKLQPISVVYKNVPKIISDKEKLSECACKNYGASRGFAAFLQCKD